MAALGVPVTRDSSTGWERRLWRSWWSVHVPELGLSEKLPATGCSNGGCDS